MCFTDWGFSVLSSFTRRRSISKGIRDFGSLLSPRVKKRGKSLVKGDYPAGLFS
jgi:hypothetical protein